MPVAAASCFGRPAIRYGVVRRVVSLSLLSRQPAGPIPDSSKKERGFGWIRQSPLGKGSLTLPAQRNVYEDAAAWPKPVAFWPCVRISEAPDEHENVSSRGSRKTISRFSYFNFNYYGSHDIPHTPLNRSSDWPPLFIDWSLSFDYSLKSATNFDLNFSASEFGVNVGLN